MSGTYRTQIKINRSNSPIRLREPLLTAGSCFADAIGERLVRYKFNVMANPFGVIYNPDSIHKVLSYAIANTRVPEHTFLVSQDIHLNYDFHSEISALHRSDLAGHLEKTVGSAHTFLKNTTHLIITYGTAWVYKRKDTGEIVANCHKVPALHFEKILLKEDEIVASFHSFYSQLKRFNKNIRIILTVSPVRHIKETLELNSVSKSILRVACHTLSTRLDDVEYFPAYEIMLDDLRDYRFYKADMIHPTEVAEDYIWDRFADRYFEEEETGFIEQWKSVRAALAHKPFHAAAPRHQEFLKATLKKLEQLSGKTDLSEEIKLIKSQIM